MADNHPSGGSRDVAGLVHPGSWTCTDGRSYLGDLVLLDSVSVGGVFELAEEVPRVEADLDDVREFARECRSAGDQISAAVQDAGQAATRLSGAGGLAERFWEACNQGQHRHLDLLRRAAEEIRNGALGLDDVAARLEAADSDSARVVSRAAGSADGDRDLG